MPAHDPNAITLWSLVSLLAGTIISALVSYFLQRRSFAEAREQKAKDRFEVQKAHAYSLFFKMIRIHSDISQLGSSVMECIEKAKTARFKGENWQIVLPLATLPDRVAFAAEEMALLLSLDASLFNDIGPYDNVHNSLIDVFEMYQRKRAAMMERFGAKWKVLWAQHRSPKKSMSGWHQGLMK